MKTQVKRIPNTTIPCAICNGTAINPSHGAECGACFGSGLSTSYCDQRKNGTTTGVTYQEIEEHGSVYAAIQASMPGVTGLEIQSKGHDIVTGITGILICWDNPHYSGANA